MDEPDTGARRKRADDRPRIVLTMIVRDEAHVIREALASVLPVIDTWVVVDTGSTDGTQQVVRSFFAEHGLPGELHERPWVGFAHNRTEALELSRPHGDYQLVFDADDVLVGTPELALLRHDAYALHFRGGLSWWRSQLFRTDRAWTYAGAVHEYPVCTDGPTEVARLRGDYHVIPRSRGARSRDPHRFDRDAELLRAEVHADPEDRRAVYYLARSLHDAGRFEEAVEWYERRIALGGWAEEVYCAHYERARCLESMGAGWERVLTGYLEAWESRPSRAEPLAALARICRLEGAHDLGYLFARQGVEIDEPDDLMPLASDVYSWRLRDTLAICAYYTGRYTESRTHCEALLAGDGLPATERLRVERNLAFAVAALEGSRPDLLVVREPEFVVVGSGRSGSGYVAALLTAAGLRCGHEGWWNPFGAHTSGLLGDSSWLALPFLDEYRGHVFHVVRHPLAVLRSLGNGDLSVPSPYLDFKLEHVPQLRHLPEPDRWAHFIVTWIEECERRAERTWRLEDFGADAVAEIGTSIGVEVRPEDAEAAVARMHRSVNQHRPGPAIGLDDVADPRLRDRLVAICDRYGWSSQCAT